VKVVLVRTIGPVEVVDDAGQPLASFSPSQRRLICALVLMSRPVPAEELRHILWPNEDATSRATLGTLVYRTRAVLPDGVSIRGDRRAGYALVLDAGCRVDLAEFRDLVAQAAEARATDLIEAEDLFSRAVALWPAAAFSGTAFPDCPDTPTLAELVEHAAAQLREAREALAETRLALGQHQRLLPDLRLWVRTDPWDEHLRSCLMLALYRAQRKAEALKVFADARRLLREEGLDAQPGPALQRLRAQIAADDPLLTPSALASPRRVPAEQARPEHVTNRPSVARILNYFQGGKDNYEVDRKAASDILAQVPTSFDMARSHSRWRRRAIREVAKAGVDQFLDLGAGLPDNGNIRAIAQEVTPHARVVYVDQDPMVASHARALLLDDPTRTAYLNADLRDADTVLNAPETRRLIYFDQPIGIVITVVLHIVPGNVDEVLAAYVDAMPPGSYLLISTVVSEDLPPDVVNATLPHFPTFVPRSEEEIRGWCKGLDIVAPGIVDFQRWRPEEDEALPVERAFCAVAWKPGTATRRI
jgi:DNA-binding SARP family transcriptional activator